MIGGHFSQVGEAEMGVSHCVVLRRMLHQVVGTLSGGISTCVLSDGKCLVGPAPSMEDGRSHLVREEELGLAELKVTSMVFVLEPWGCVAMVTSPLLCRSNVTPWLWVTLGCSVTSLCLSWAFHLREYQVGLREYQVGLREY